MNFLQKGLAGLESRLDKVLLDESEAAALAQEREQRLAEQKKAAATAASSIPPHASATAAAPRSSSESSARPSGESERAGAAGSQKLSMQERLAAAMAAKNRSTTPARSASPAGKELGRSNSGATRERGAGRQRRDSGMSVRSLQKEAPPRASGEGVRDAKEGGVQEIKVEDPDAQAEQSEQDTKQDAEEEGDATAETEAGQDSATDGAREGGTPRLSIDVPTSSRQSTDSATRPGSPPPLPSAQPILENGTAAHSREDLEATIARLQEDLLVCETRRQEESHAASERIDALEEKIRYLARESAEASRRRASSTGAGGLEKKLAECEEKIALLLDEGEKLSKNELKLQNTIKKLRAKTQEEERGAADAKRRLDKAEKEAADAKEKVRRAQEAEKAAQQRIKALAKLEAEVDALRKDREASKGAVAELREKLEAATRRADEAESRVQTEALEKERKTTVELKAQVERVQGEAALVEERLRSEIRDLKNKMERDAEKSRMREAELKGEQSVMESKMEALRARAEEVSSGATGDAHAKLLRQVETLQTQYAIASENWQGIEGSLLARVASLEKERDDLAKKEGDIRRKAREMNLKSKTLELDLDNATSKIKDLETEAASHAEQTSSLRQRLADLEAAVDTARSNAAAERAAWQQELQTRLDEERAKWELQTSRQASPSPPPAGAPLIRKPSSALSTTESYFVGYARSSISGRPPSRSVSAEPPPDSITSLQDRKPSSTSTTHYNPYYNNSNNSNNSNNNNSRVDSRAGFRTPPVRHDSAASIFRHHNSSRTSLPAAGVDDDNNSDFFFDHQAATTPTSPPRQQQHADLLSVSTVAAGPSVQLVERMSAAVRRLESEMAGSREEMARMTAQRDEARAEVVELMRELDEKRGVETRVRQMEAEMEDVRVKYGTTLEMLGEKSERVAELEADVVDLKQMYRELVSQTVK